MRRVGVFYRECITVFAQLSDRAQPGFPAEEPSNMTGIQCDHELCITGLHKNLWHLGLALKQRDAVILFQLLDLRAESLLEI